MANIAPRVVERSPRYLLHQWTLGQGDVALPVEEPALGDRSVQVTGDFDGATVAVQGSLDKTNYSTLTDPMENALTFTGTRIETVTEAVMAIKPVLSGAGPNAALVVTLFSRI